MIKLIYLNDKKSVFQENEEISIDSYIKNIDIDKEVFSYLQFIEKQEIEGMNLEDFYLYNHVGMYCFERHGIYEKLKGIFYCFFVVKNIKEEFKQEIFVETDNEIMADICIELFNIQVHKVYDHSRTLDKKILDKKTLFKLALRNLKGIRNYIKFLTNSKKNKENFLSVSNAININKVNIEGNDELIDTQLGITTKALSKKYNMFNIQYMYNFNILDKSLKYKEGVIPFELFVIYKKICKDKYIQKDLIKDSLNKLEFIDYKYNNYDFKSILKKHIFKNIRNRYLDDIRELVCAKRLIKKLNIKRCIVVDEGDRPREFIMAGNMENIKTYALQHGIINSMSPAYIINSKYKDKIIPNCTFLWGDKYKNILINNTNIYNNENIMVVGQSRTDLLKQYINKTANEDTKIKILYATQYYKDILEPATNILFETLSLLEKDYEIVIKLHPADNYYDIYKFLIQKYKIKNVKIVKEGDIYELIYWCDVVVSVHSTVIVEAAMLNKPSVCILLPKYNDAGGFVKDGISKGVKNKIELKHFLDNINEFEFNSEFSSYIKDNFYIIDGKVTDRIIDNINNK